MDVLDGVVAGIILAAILGLLWVRKRVDDFKVTLRRSWNDYWLWSYDSGRRRHDEYQRGKRVHLERGTFATEEHLAQAEALMDRYSDEQRARMRRMCRDIDDARRSLRRIDVAMLSLTTKDTSFRDRVRGLWRGLTTEPYSMETDILERVLEVERRGELDAFLKDAEEAR